MRIQETLGEAKFGICVQCHSPFPMRRADQKFCQRACGRKYHNGKNVWAERKDRDIRNVRRQVRYYETREQSLERAKEWRRTHPAEAQARDHAKYLRNKETIAARVKLYRKKHPEVRTREYKNGREKFPWKHPFYNARNRSQKSKLSFDLTYEWCAANWTGKCAFSGLPFAFGTSTHFPLAPSIDRIDNTRGYTQDNCRFVLFAINAFKGSGNDHMVFEIAQAIVRNNILERVPL